MKRKLSNMLRIAVTGGLIIAFAAAMSGLLSVKKASASMTAKSDVMTRLQDNTASNHTIQFTTSVGVAEGETITVTFPAAFDTASIVEDDVDVKDDVTELTTAANCAGTDKASVVMAADILTITLCAGDGGAIAGGSVVEIQIGTNATSYGTGSYQIVNADIAADTSYDITIGGTMVDSGNLRIQLLMDDSVNITAVVDETISFAIPDTTIGFGDLISSTGRWATGDLSGGNASDPATPTAAHTMTIGTNATGGWAITYYGATLTSPDSDTITDANAIVHDSDGTPGTEQFGLCASTNGDSTIASGYARSSDAEWDFVPSTTTTLVSELGPTATETISVSYLGNVSTATEAGSYSTDITYVATATF